MSAVCPTLRAAPDDASYHHFDCKDEHLCSSSPVTPCRAPLRRLPLTLYFRSWEKEEALPAISSSFFLLWPPAVQMAHALSYPAELLQEWATTVIRRIAMPSKDALPVRSWNAQLLPYKYELNRHTLAIILLIVGHSRVLNTFSVCYIASQLQSFVSCGACGNVNAEGTTTQGHSAATRSQCGRPLQCHVRLPMVAGALLLRAARCASPVAPVSIHDRCNCQHDTHGKVKRVITRVVEDWRPIRGEHKHGMPTWVLDICSQTR